MDIREEASNKEKPRLEEQAIDGRMVAIKSWSSGARREQEWGSVSLQPQYFPALPVGRDRWTMVSKEVQMMESSTRQLSRTVQGESEEASMPTVPTGLGRPGLCAKVDVTTGSRKLPWFTAKNSSHCLYKIILPSCPTCSVPVDVPFWFTSCCQHFIKTWNLFVSEGYHKCPENITLPSSGYVFFF